MWLAIAVRELLCESVANAASSWRATITTPNALTAACGTDESNVSPSVQPSAISISAHTSCRASGSAAHRVLQHVCRNRAVLRAVAVGDDLRTDRSGLWRAIALRSMLRECLTALTTACPAACHPCSHVTAANACGATAGAMCKRVPRCWVELRRAQPVHDLREARDDLRVAQSMRRLLHGRPATLSVFATSAATSTAAASSTARARRMPQHMLQYGAELW